MADSSASAPPVAKKPKLENDDDDDQDKQLLDVANQAWEHYQSYVDSTADDEGDLDELEEIVQVVVKPFLSQLRPYNTCTTTTASVTDLLPVLVSVAYFHLADNAISDCLELQQLQREEGDQETENVLALLLQKCQELIELSLHWFPKNAAMWSMAANFGRMFHRLLPATICQWYETSVECAGVVRTAALQLLDDDNTPLPIKEWVELLLLDRVLGVDYVVDEQEGDEEEQTEAKHKEDDAEEEQGHFSSSAVEATARFMASMLHSTSGHHDRALQHLQHFDLTHRLHPNVWQPPSSPSNSNAAADNSNDPIVFLEKVIPDHLYQRLCEVFAPNAAYWTESEYQRRGYYSYYMDIPEAVGKNTSSNDTKTSWTAQNVIEDVICNHLLPLVQQRVKAACSDPSKNSTPHICGAEWWVHTRAVRSNLGHNLHFDTDEALLKQEGSITHPLYSSVLYLTGGDSDNAAGGATILLDQTPDSDRVAQKAWRCVPKNKSFMVFPGNLLHGVLPCPGPVQDSERTDGQLKVDDQDSSDVAGSIRSQWVPMSQHAKLEQSTPHRLTFMVGFWTRRVPDKMKEQKLYGPCGPLPPRPSASGGHGDKHGENDMDEPQEHTWVDQICQGYPANESSSNHDDDDDVSAPVPSALSFVTPAWETISSLKNDSDAQDEFLEIPKAIDHRFFVHGAPRCFRDSLFERDDDEDDEDQEAEEAEQENV